MDTLLTVLVVVAGLAILDTQTAEAGASVALEKKLMAMEVDAMEQWRHGDPMRWAEISAPEVTYIDPGLTRPIVGLKPYTSYLEALKGQVLYQGSEFINPRVVRYGDLAVMTYNYHSTVNNPDGTLNRENLWNTTEVYARFGEEWRIIHTHWSYVNHSAPDALEVPVTVAVTPLAHSGVLAELVRLESAAMERWRRGDPWGFVEISDEAVTYFDSGTPHRLDGRAALREEYARRVGKIHYDVMEFLDPMAQVHGDAAVLVYRFFSTRLRPDGSVERRTPWNCTEVFAKRDGVWRIVHTHWSLLCGRKPGAQGLE